MVEGMGGQYWSDEKGEPMLTEDSTIEAMQRLVDKVVPYTADDHTYDPQAAIFSDGNAPMTINGPWAVSGFQDAGIDLGVAKFPTFSGGSPNPAGGIDMWLFLNQMDKDESRGAAARAFSEWSSTTEEEIITAAKKRGRPPVLKSVVGDDRLPPIVNGFAEAIKQGHMQYRHPEVKKLWTPLSDGMTRIVDQGASVEEVFTEVQNTVEKKLNN